MSVASVNGNHWVAYAVDSVNQRILIDNSLAADGNGAIEFLAALRWWLGTSGMVDFRICTMEINQQTDTHSCGLFAVNAVLHFLAPTIALLRQPDVKKARLESYLSVVCKSTFTAETEIVDVIMDTMQPKAKLKTRRESDPVAIKMDATLTSDEDIPSGYNKTLRGYFPTLSGDALLEYKKKQRMVMREEREEWAMELEEQTLEQMARRQNMVQTEREKARERKQRQHKRRKEAEIESGLRESDGSVKKKKKVSLSCEKKPVLTSDV